MTVKIGAKRWATYFSALRATGNRALAAERAKVSQSWVRQRQADDPAFRAEMAAAIASAGARLDRAASAGPAAARWRDQDGEELTVRRADRRWRQITRARLNQWTPRVEARFLGALAVSCNVTRACSAVGLSTRSAYDHRERWPAFAERWDQAIEDGYDRLSTALVAHTGAMLGDADLAPEVDMGPITVAEALQVLHLYRARIAGEERRLNGGRRRLPLQLADVRESILDKFEVIERAIQAKMTAEDRERRRAMLWGEIPLTDELIRSFWPNPAQIGSLSAPIATSSIE
jgi:hypothetical protein